MTAAHFIAFMRLIGWLGFVVACMFPVYGLGGLVWMLLEPRRRR